ncbi:hypothetical protein DWY69_00170 [Eisenbergiella massiliensis]|uniref:Uncharacterized protein n=1 Tax=Eisenbergiella massiliensis TaxID=1720294 RepID=A0A3E3J524_9FIRM|nr:hypothetical protein DWY69_00170 [Eisenbergiella massiliensis]
MLKIMVKYNCSAGRFISCAACEKSGSEMSGYIDIIQILYECFIVLLTGVFVLTFYIVKSALYALKK